MTSLRVLTYNIHKGFSISGRRFVLHNMRQALQSVDADIVCLQEIQGEHLKHQNNHPNWPEENQLEFLADSLWPHTAYGKNAVYQHGHHGNGILSRYPFVEWENINVSDQQRASRSLLHAVITPPGAQRIHIICVHLGLFESERRRQMARLAERIESHVPHQEALIIAGDFNDWRGLCDHYLRSVVEVEEVFMAHTGRHARSFPATFPLMSLDRIYVRGLVVDECACLMAPQWRSLSDHVPLYVSLRLPS